MQVWGLYTPVVPGPAGVPGLDKIGHALLFGIPAALAWALRAPWVVLLLVGHALVSEPLQHHLVPGRMMDPWDAVADLVGIALGVALVRAWRQRSGHDGGMPSTAPQEGS